MGSYEHFRHLGITMSKKYDVIYADPPWKYGSRGARGGKFGDLDYPQMSIKDLCDLDVISISSDISHLYMWATSPFLMESQVVANAWGFDQYIRVEKVWNKKKESGKPHGVCGPHGMTDTEFLLLFCRGGKTTSLYNNKKRNQYTATDEVYTGKHSEKPAIFRGMIEQKFITGLNKLEMFSRGEFEGWDVFGNQCEGSIKIKSK